MIPESLFGPLLEAVPDGIVLVDREGLVAHVNRRLEEMSGYTRQELLGEPIEKLVPERLRGAHGNHRERYQESEPVRRAMGSGLDIRFLRRDGGEFPADIALSPLQIDGESYVVAAVRDISERKSAERRMESMLEIADTILRGDPADSVLELIARSSRSLVGAALAMVSVPESGDFLLTKVAEGRGADRVHGMRVPLDESIAGRTLKMRKPLLVPDLRRDPRAYQPAVEAAELGPAIYAALGVEDRSFGTLVVANQQGDHEFTEDDLQVVELFAAQASVALEYARLREEVERLAVAEDRERIARELHDGAIQALFAVGMSLQATALKSSDAGVQSRLEGDIARIDGVIRDLRNYIFGLRPGLLSDRELDHAMRELAADLERESGVTTVADIDSVLAAELAPRAADLIQLAREALSNVGRHSEAMTCRLSLRRAGDQAVLEIDDDGAGFDLDAAQGKGQGLRNFEERAARLGGQVTVESAGGDGTAVRFTFPLKPG